MKSLSTILAAFALSSVLSFAVEPAVDKPAVAAEQPAVPAGEKPKRDPAKMIEKLDTNKDGAISLEEFKAGPKGKKDPVKAEEFFKKLDKDGNGSVSAEEMAGAAHGGKKNK